MKGCTRVDSVLKYFFGMFSAIAYACRWSRPVKVSCQYSTVVSEESTKGAQSPNWSKEHPYTWVSCSKVLQAFLVSNVQ